MRCLFPSLVYTRIRCCGLVLALFIGLIFTGGCQKPEPPPVAYMGPTLASADLGLVEPVDTEANGFVILETAASKGRFPAALAVVRLDQPNPLFVSDEPLFTAERGWEVSTLKEQEAAYWNGLLKTVPMTRGVFVLDRRSVVSPNCDLDQVIRAVRRVNIELCLIYGPRLASDDSAAFAGVIIDTETGTRLAYIQSEAGVFDFEPPRPDRPKNDRSHQDVNYLAARRFEREARGCIIELINRDQPAPTTQPSPWRGMELRGPVEPVPLYIVPNSRVGG